ncbi:Importin-beta N-terminal domain [Musa troglodytarum]|uniref:Importin-beta N-terminal domain n=1 Tax=Musa troglodytarum TaxID=320322 RepID=A0A9E7KG39_9LILI|nr:Importin-beta N-terminal domain [Musa troglodytarum]
MARFGRRETRLRIFPGRGVALSAADVQTVCPILSNALSLDESAFGQIENRQEFCFCLLEIVTARDSGRRDDVRLLASVYQKPRLPIKIVAIISMTSKESNLKGKDIKVLFCGGSSTDFWSSSVCASSAVIFDRVLVMNTNYFAQSASEPSLAMALQQAGLSINQKVYSKGCSLLTFHPICIYPTLQTFQKQQSLEVLQTRCRMSILNECSTPVHLAGERP